MLFIMSMVLDHHSNHYSKNPFTNQEFKKTGLSQTFVGDFFLNLRKLSFCMFFVSVYHPYFFSIFIRFLVFLNAWYTGFPFVP